MISQSKIKLINSLDKKKFRDQTQLFIAEGEKLVFDLMHSKIKVIELFIADHYSSLSKIPANIPYTVITEQYFKKISQLKTPPSIIALCQIPHHHFDPQTKMMGLSLALDDIQDPGNLGTIIRLADWFGIQDIVCSVNTADGFNPKVVQATMGAIARVKLHYTHLDTYLSCQQKNKTIIYGTFLNGDNIYEQSLTKDGIVVMGNEGKGISPVIEKYITKKLLIPSFAHGTDQSESLNVSMATGIVLSEFRRRNG